MSILKRQLGFAGLVLAVSSFTFSARAQSTTGSIYGTVTDTTGAIIANSTVTAKDVHTGVTQTATTNGSGDYTFPAVNPGDYEVSDTTQGFKTQNQTGVTVSANQNVHVTFSLEPGATSESVDVVADVTMVDTRGSQLAETIEQDRIQNLPTLNRSTYDLVQTAPGVSNYTPDRQIGSNMGTGFSVNGLPADMVSFYLDGSYNNTFKQGGGNKTPNPDAIQEFRLITSNFDAEFGRSPGAVANVITRSGTAQFHGSAYDYLRNDILNARPYFQAPGPRQPLKQNQFGGTLGGPILRDKLFFFGSYEQLILHQTANVNAGAIILPTALERSGDFTQSKIAPTALPAGTNCAPGGKGFKICPAALDPVAQAVLKYVPLPDANGIAPQQTAAQNVSSYQGLGRLDYSGFQNHSIEAMYFYAPGTDQTPLAGGNQIVGYSGMTNAENQRNIVLSDNWTVNSRAVNSIRGFYTNNKFVISNQFNGPFLSDLGSTAPEGGTIFSPPQFAVGGYFTVGPSNGGPNNNSQTSYGLIDTATLSRGHHQIKLGGSYVWSRFTSDGARTSGGQFNFANNSSIKGSTALADFLLGKANAFTQASVSTHRTHQYDPALYAQDDWQIRPRLSLNLGLRWEMFAPHCCEPTVTGTFIAGQQSTVVPTAPLGLVYQGDKNVATGLVDTSLLDFAPRVGFAYDVDGNGKTSLRGGFGIFYQTISEINYAGLGQLPFSLQTTVNKTPNLVAPYGAGGSPYPFVNKPSAPRFADNATTQGVTPGQTAPYVYEYNLTVERQLNPTFAFRLGYVGNATRKNVINLDDNAPIYSPGAGVDTASIDCRRPYQPYRVLGKVPGTCTYAGYSGSIGGGDPTAGKQFGPISVLTPALNANYNSLQTSLRGRIGDKFNMLASYVWSRSLGYNGPTVDNTDIRKNYGLTDTDVRHRFVISYTYRFNDAKVWGAFGRQVLGGWRVNGVTILQTGSPFTVTSGSDTNLDGTNNDRADVIGDPYNHVKGRQAKIFQGILNGAAFSVPTGPYGSSRRDQFIGPGNINTNLSLFKELAIRDQLRFQFRAESFNVFGNVNLNNPRTNYSVFSGLPAGQNYITGASDPRRMQFAAKLLF